MFTHHTDETTNSTQPRAEKKHQNSFVREVAVFGVIVLAIVLPIRLFVAQPFIVNGSSMDPTFASGQYLIIDEISYRFGEPERGEVVVFSFPDRSGKFFIKRIIGLPKETVHLRGEEIVIVNEGNPEGMALQEAYVKNRPAHDQQLSVTLDGDEYFVMGDNRAVSFDSRSWGPLKRELIVGRALARLLPFSAADVFPGDESDAFE